MGINIQNVKDIVNGVWDIRDLIARVEELEQSDDQDDIDELAQGTFILEELCGQGGDEQWRGDWYPLTIIHEDAFTDYCEELVKDISDLPRDLPSYLAIDWEATADNIKVDYSSIEIDGETYFFR